MQTKLRCAPPWVFVLGILGLTLGGCGRETDKERIAREYGTTPEAMDAVLAKLKAAPRVDTTADQPEHAKEPNRGTK